MAKKQKNVGNEGTPVENKAEAKLDQKALSPEEKKERAKKQQSDYSYVIKNRRVRTAAKHRKIVTVVSVVLAILLCLSGLVTAIFMVAEENTFNVFVSNHDGIQSMSLSHSADLSNPTEVLELHTPGRIDNTTLAKGHQQVDTPAIEELLETIVNNDGMQSTADDKHIASTFYLINNTDKPQPYVEFLQIKNDTKDIASALRVMLVRNGEIMVYAKKKANGEPEMVVPLQNNVYPKLNLTISETEDGKNLMTLVKPEKDEDDVEPWYAEPFYSDEYVFYNTSTVLQPGEAVKYSVILWLEGWDEDCNNDRLQGTIFLDLGFQQLNAEVTE